MIDRRYPILTPLSVRRSDGIPRCPSVSGEPILCKWTNSCTAIPNVAVNDDVYEGYHIPKGMSYLFLYRLHRHNNIYTGATVMTNLWFAYVVLAHELDVNYVFRCLGLWHTTSLNIRSLSSSSLSDSFIPTERLG